MVKPAIANSAKASVGRRRAATGPKRPKYLADRDLDRMMIMLVTLMGEVSALRDRLDTHEALADNGKPNRTEEVERYSLTEQRNARREAARMAMVRRVFRVLMEELESGKTSTAYDFSKLLEPEA